jgi:hypothetical protein
MGKMPNENYSPEEIDKNRHWDKKTHASGRGAAENKVPVVGAVKRKDNVVVRVIDNVKGDTLEKFVNEAVSTRVSLLCADDFVSYNRMHYRYPHGTVDHGKGKYVVDAIHTNTIEGFWSLIKRGCVGTFHKVSKKYLPLYVAEFQFRYSNRTNSDIFGTAISGC